MGIKERWHKTKPLPPDIMERIDMLPSLFNEKGVMLAYLFGSLLHTQGNDVDIALLYEGDFDDIRREIHKKLGTSRVDIVNLKAAPVLISFEVISTGKMLFSQNEDTENLFEMKIIKQYQDFGPVRNKQLIRLKENLGIGI
ncbi:MAG: nucleotidyltransferase domain-containing protein [Nitrospirae bacterium]|nr:nucleotidyltransferase domain-containing protein [Nitrospirota bacterium]